MRRISEANKWGYKTIQEISSDVYNGSEITRIQLNTGGHPAIKCGDLNSKLGAHFDTCISYVDACIIKRKKYFSKGDLLVSNLSNKVETVGSASAYLGDEDGLAGLGVTVVKHNQSPRFLGYIMSSKFCRDQIQSQALKGTVVNFWNEKIKQIKIPLPPLEEQERIVSLLDPLYEMCGDAEKGIPALIAVIQKQYQYYKEELLKF